MHNHRHIILLSILLLFIGFGCSKADQDTSFIYNLEEEFVIRPVELLSATGSNLSLEISSLQIDPCDNSEILYQYRQVNGVSTIALDDITSPENCNTTEIRPSINIALSPGIKNTRLLNITIKDIIENDGQIDEFDDRYEINMNSTDGIRISHRELLKVQPSILWGGADYNNITDANVANTFISELADMTRAKTLKQGYYGQFELMSTGDVSVWNDVNDFDLRSAFAFDASLSLSAISNVVEDYRSRYPNMRFFAYNAFGESL